MKLSVMLVAAGLLAFSAGAASAQTVVNNTDLGVVAGATQTTNANGTTTTYSGVSPARVSEGTTAGKWSQNNIGGGGVVGVTNTYGDGPSGGAGNGSAYFSASSSASKADLEFYLSAPVALSSFTGGSYDWFRDAASNNPSAQVPSYRLLISNGKSFSNLIFEPIYQSNPQVDPVEAAWQSSLVTGASKFWSSQGGLVLPAGLSCWSCAQGASLDDIKAVNSGWYIYAFSTGVGSGWNGQFSGAVDNFSFTLDGQTSTYDFEVAGVPEPATWAMMIMGFGLAGSALRRRRVVLAA